VTDINFVANAGNPDLIPFRSIEDEEQRRQEVMKQKILEKQRKKKELEDEQRRKEEEEKARKKREEKERVIPMSIEKMQPCPKCGTAVRIKVLPLLDDVCCVCRSRSALRWWTDRSAVRYVRQVRCVGAAHLDGRGRREGEGGGREEAQGGGGEAGQGGGGEASQA
jgi:hypothetical protein